MHRLTALDTAFFKTDDFSDQHGSLSIGAVAIVDGPTPDYDLLKELVAQRIQGIQGIQGIQAIPQGTNQPGWDLTHQVRRVALPRPGDEAELFGAIAQALERPLDPDRPLWECWVIDGLRDDKWAILMKTHPGLADGISAAHLLSRLCDGAQGDVFVHHEAQQQVSSPTDGIKTWLDALWRASTTVAATMTRAAATAAGVVWPSAQTFGGVTTMRRYSTVRIPLADVELVCRKFGVTANEVALAVITEGFRKVLLQRGEQPRANSLPTLAPVPAMLPYLPVEQQDPILRLRTVQRRLTQGPPPSKSPFLPSELCAKAFQLLTRLPQRGIVTLATHAAGPRQQLLLMGQRLEQLLPIPPTARQLSTGVAVLSYGDNLVFGLTADYDAAPQMEQLAAGIEVGMARLMALSQDSVLLFGSSRDRRTRTSRDITRGARASAASARARR